MNVEAIYNLVIDEGGDGDILVFIKDNFEQKINQFREYLKTKEKIGLGILREQRDDKSITFSLKELDEWWTFTSNKNIPDTIKNEYIYYLEI